MSVETFCAGNIADTIIIITVWSDTSQEQLYFILTKYMVLMARCGSDSSYLNIHLPLNQFTHNNYIKFKKPVKCFFYWIHIV